MLVTQKPLPFAVSDARLASVTGHKERASGIYVGERISYFHSLVCWGGCFFVFVFFPPELNFSFIFTHCCKTLKPKGNSWFDCSVNPFFGCPVVIFVFCYVSSLIILMSALSATFLVPSAPILQLEALNCTSIVARWQSSLESVAIQGYRLCYHEEGQPEQPDIQLQAQTNTYTIGGLGECA